jgi:hypothetical protein
MDVKPVAGDRFTVFPVAIALLLIGVWFASTYASNNFERFGDWSFFALLAAFVAAVGCLVVCFARLARKQWRRSISHAVALALLVGCFVARHEIFHQIDHLRFRVFRAHYVDNLVDARDAAGTRPVRALQWGWWAHFLSGEYHRILVYDETDQIGAETLPCL